VYDDRKHKPDQIQIELANVSVNDIINLSTKAKQAQFRLDRKRGHDFSRALQDDFASRCLFSMVRDMYDLQVKNEVGNAPLLTIPVGSGR
jgi:hypothetical protein